MDIVLCALRSTPDRVLNLPLTFNVTLSVSNDGVHLKDMAASKVTERSQTSLPSSLPVSAAGTHRGSSMVILILPGVPECALPKPAKLGITVSALQFSAVIADPANQWVSCISCKVIAEGSVGGAGKSMFETLGALPLTVFIGLVLVVIFNRKGALVVVVGNDGTSGRTIWNSMRKAVQAGRLRLGKYLRMHSRMPSPYTSPYESLELDRFRALCQALTYCNVDIDVRGRYLRVHGE